MHLQIIIWSFFLLLIPAFSQIGEVSDLSSLEREIRREVVPAQILSDAVTEVQKIGDETLQGKFATVVSKMYPRYRKRAAKELGSQAELEVQLRRAIEDLAASGIAIVGFSAEPAFYGFEVPEFDEWVVFVPTVRVIRRIDPVTGLVERGEIKDYQVAIRKKREGSTWSFLNGSTMKVSELRSFFPSLPRDLEEYAIPKKSYRKLP